MKNLKLLLTLTAFLVMILSCKNDAPPVSSEPVPHPLQKEIDSLEMKLVEISQQSVIPGFSVNIFQEENMIFSKGFGYADEVNKHRFTPQTKHIIASISKTFIGVAIMKLIEDGKLNLDDPVNDFLPFEITSPHFPKTPITIQHLVTHTSSLNDDFDDGEKRPSQLLEKSIYKPDEMPKELAGDIYYWDGTALALEDYIKEVFTPSGKWYGESNFTNFEPGEKYEYSNEGVNLAGLIIEKVSGMSLSDFSEKYIFQPLDMTSTSWDYPALDSTVSKVYIQYEKEYPGQVFEFPRAMDSGQPCGDLKSTADDLSKYLLEMMNGFYGKGKILNSKSYQMLLNPLLSRNKIDDDDASALNDGYDVGVLWAMSKPGLRIHKGGSIGVFSLIYFNPENKVGVATFCNLAHPDFGVIVNTIRAFEEKIRKKSVAKK